MITVDYLMKKHYGSEKHPYKIYEEKIEAIIKKDSVILDAGCGRNAPVLSKFINRAKQLIGVDLETQGNHNDTIKYIQGSIDSIDLPSNTADIVISRAVLEHIKNPYDVFKEINRVLKPKGDFIFLVPNLYDYVSIMSFIIPNRFHQKIVSKLEGRQVDDVFPAFYKVNTYSAICNISQHTNFKIESYDPLSQYPSMFMFNTGFFVVGMLYDKLIRRYEKLGFLRGWLLVHLKKINESVQ